jgi:hypothetical protein
LGKRKMESKATLYAVGGQRIEARDLETQIRNTITRYYNVHKSNPPVIMLNEYNYNLLNKDSVCGVKLVVAKEAVCEIVKNVF